MNVLLLCINFRGFFSQNGKSHTKKENFKYSSNKVQWRTPTDVFLPKFHADLSRYKEKQLRCTRYKNTYLFHCHFAPLWPRVPKFCNTWDFSSAYMHV